MRRNTISTQVVLLCLFLVGHLASYGQDLTSEDSVVNMPRTRYWTFALGNQAVQLNDRHMSPLNYFGSSIYLQTGVFKRKKKSLRNFTFGATYNNISPKEDNRDIDPRGQYFRVDFAYSQQHYIKSFFDGKIRWYAGGKIKSHSNVRLNPQLDGGFITFLFANGLFASNVLEHDFRISKRPLTVNWQLDVPIVNHLIRPSFLNIYDFVNPEHDWIEERIDASGWAAINKYSNVTSTLSLLYPIKSTNALRFSYEWDFYRVSRGLRATSATHTYLFSILFNF